MKKKVSIILTVVLLLMIPFNFHNNKFLSTTALALNEHEHSFTNETTREATCSLEGIIWHFCDCGYNYPESIPKIPHSWDAYYTVTDATAFADGFEKRQCLKCHASETKTINKKNVEDMQIFLTLEDGEPESAEISVWIYSLGDFKNGNFSIPFFKENFDRYSKIDTNTAIDYFTEVDHKIYFSFHCTDNDGLYNPGYHKLLTISFSQDWFSAYSDLYTKELTGTINNSIKIESVYYFDDYQTLFGYEKTSGESFFECSTISDLSVESHSGYDYLILSFWSNDQQTDGVYEINYDPYLLYPRDVVSINCEAEGNYSDAWQGKFSVFCDEFSKQDNDSVELFWIYFEIVDDRDSNIALDIFSNGDKANKLTYECAVIGHNYKITTTDPTCEIPGNIKYDYSGYGDWKEFTIEIPVDENAHNWDNGTITTTATCNVKGVKTYICEYNPEHTYTEEIGINDANHVNTKNTEAITPTCSEIGYTAGVYCNDCQKYISGHKEIPVNANAHKWDNGTITTMPTCITSGVKTYTCQNNTSHNKTENLSVNASIHVNTKNVAETTPTCTTKGYTAGVYCNDCQKHISGHDEIPVDENAHIWDNGTITTPATHLTEGVMTYTCKCGDTYTEIIAKTTEHTYNTIVIEPTCTDRGITLYFCVCNDFYMADYVNANGHSHTATITTPATHLKEGVMTYICSCGDTYTEAIAKTTEHTYNAVVSAPTCTDEGFTTYTCACGDSYIDNVTDLADHTDGDGDEFCDYCDEFMGSAAENNCSHMCHQSGFMGFIWKIINFFQKLFGMNPICECGAYHY